MNTKALAEGIRKYTLSKPFNFKEFITMTNLENDKAAQVFNQLVLDCHVKPSGKTDWRIIHGESRDKFIDEKIVAIEEKIKGYFTVLEHIKGLKEKDA